MSDEQEYFIAGGKDLARYEAFMVERNAAVDRLRVLEAQYGGQGVFQGERLIGLTLPACPEGWRKVGSLGVKPYYFPLRKSKAGKETANKLEKYSVPGASSLHRAFFDSSFGFMAKNSLTFRSMSARVIGGVVVLIMPEGHTFEPDGSRKIPTSEYWRMIENAKAVSEGASA